jgi:hypothetical protein
VAQIIVFIHWPVVVHGRGGGVLLNQFHQVDRCLRGHAGGQLVSSRGRYRRYGSEKLISAPTDSTKDTHVRKPTPEETVRELPDLVDITILVIDSSDQTLAIAKRLNLQTFAHDSFPIVSGHYTAIRLWLIIERLVLGLAFGFGVLATSLQFGLQKIGLRSFRIFSEKGRRLEPGYTAYYNPHFSGEHQG